MKRKALALTLISTLLLTLATAQVVSRVNANFTPLPELPTPIYIKNDGSVDPPTVPLQRTGNTYTFTSNIDNTIEVQRPNIMLNGNGFALTKPAVNTEGLMMPIGWLPGVSVVGMNNVTIMDITFESCITGVTVENSSSVTISRNTIRECESGIVVLSSFDINILGNNIVYFSTGIHFLPSNPKASSPHHIKIERNQISGNSNQVPATPPQPEQYGIWGGFSGSQMTGNNLTNIKGIALYYTGSNNLIVGNNFQDNYEGILFSEYSELSVNNTIYGNNFNHNSENVVVPFIRNPPINFWDNGTVGNYWSDYNGADVNGNGVGDTPYIIETVYQDYDLNKNVTVQEGKDNYPLMVPFDISSLTIALPEWSHLPPATPSQENPLTEPLPTALVAASTASALAGISVVLLVYLKKRKS
jgi:parallel beta-helix repeat protein